MSLKRTPATCLNCRRVPEHRCFRHGGPLRSHHKRPGEACRVCRRTRGQRCVRHGGSGWAYQPVTTEACLDCRRVKGPCHRHGGPGYRYHPKTPATCLNCRQVKGQCRRHGGGKGQPRATIHATTHRPETREALMAMAQHAAVLLAPRPDRGSPADDGDGHARQQPRLRSPTVPRAGPVVRVAPPPGPRPWKVAFDRRQAVARLALDPEVIVEEKKWRPCLAEGHDHLILTTKAVRLCGRAKQAVADGG